MKANIKIIGFVFFLFLIFPLSVQAKQAEEKQDEEENVLLDELDFSEVDAVVDEIMQEDFFSFQEMIEQCVEGEQPFSIETFFRYFTKYLFQEMSSYKNTVVRVMIVAIVAAIFTNFTNVFENAQVSEVSFYIIYLLLLAMLLKSFSIVTNVSTRTLTSLVDFMKALMPAFFLTLAASTGTASSVMFYEFVLFLITVVHWLLLNLLIPLTNIYVVMILVNNLSKEDFLSKMAELIKLVIEWLLKSLLALVIGFNVVQSLLAPMIDTFKTTTFHKAVTAIPGVGNTMNAVTDIVIGSGVLIKNSVGAAALFILLLICMIPMIQMAVFAFAYKLVAAIIQPVSDKRMIACISGVGDGARLLMRVVCTSGVLFLITVAIVTASTS